MDTTGTANCWNDNEVRNYSALVDVLTSSLKLKTIPIGMKRFHSESAMQSIERIRIPSPDRKLNMDQVVGQCRWQGFTLGVTAEHLSGPQCSAVVGLSPRDESFLSGDNFAGYWYETIEDSARHQASMSCASFGEYRAVAVSPLVSGRLGNPDICLIYATPGQMIILINALQWSGYKKLQFSCVGESACADSWGNALKTGEPSVSIPCYAERKFGGVLDDELLIALPPSYLPGIARGLEALNRNGLCYPIPSASIEVSPIEILAKAYG